jgi:hypothetical protein
MKIKTAELTGRALDWAVAKGAGHKVNVGFRNLTYVPKGKRTLYKYEPTINWSQGGPIIEREEIDTSCIEGPEDLKWEAIKLTKNGRSVFCFKGPTPLIAAMRCYVASKLGDEVEVPNELV